MHPDDAIDSALRSGNARAYAVTTDGARRDDAYCFVRALMIGAPLSLLFWTGIGFAIFR